MSYGIKTLVVAVATVIATVASGSPASAEVPVVDEALFAQEISFETPEMPFALVIPLLSGEGCIVRLRARARFYKPRFSHIIRESGSVESRPEGGGCANGIRDNHAFSSISDHGVGPLASTQSTSDSSSTSGNGIAYASAYQEVSVYSFPTDYHGPGSLIRWTDRVSIYFEGYGRVNVCADFTAIYPGSITGGWGACAG